MTRFHSILLLALVLTGCAHQQPLGLIDDHNLEVPSQQALSRLLGTWQGLLGETGLHVFFRFDQPSRGLTTGLINSPDEGLGTIPITALRIDGDSLHIEFATIKAVFEGRFLSEESAIEGLFTSQSGKIFSLPLERVDPATLAFLVPRFKENGERAFRYTYRPPPQLDDGWPVGHIDSLSEPALTEVMERILDQSLTGVESVLIIKRLFGKSFRAAHGSFRPIDARFFGP